MALCFRIWGGDNTFTGDQTIMGDVILTGSINDGLVIEPNPTSPNIIGGSSSNTVDSGVVGGTIGGGGTATAANLVTGDFATVGGGSGNQAGGAAVAPIQSLTTQGNVSALPDNTAQSHEANVPGQHATVGGGENNIASGDWSTVGGGGGKRVFRTWQRRQRKSVDRGRGHRQLR